MAPPLGGRKPEGVVLVVVVSPFGHDRFPFLSVWGTAPPR
nr:MAG TPA: hypothetical protein [Caudoviricetes sp.]